MRKISIEKAQRVVRENYMVKSADRLIVKYIEPIKRLINEPTVKFKKWESVCHSLRSYKLAGNTQYEYAIDILTKCDIEYIHKNIAPRGAADGDVLSLTPNGRRRMKALFSRYL